MSKKILACILVVCMLMPAISAMALIYPAGFGSDGTANVNGRVVVNASGFYFYGDSNINSAITGGAVTNLETTLTFDDFVLEINRKFDSNSKQQIWFTSLLPTDHAIVGDLVEAAFADENLYNALKLTSEGEIDLTTAERVKSNVMRYLYYKTLGFHEDGTLKEEIVFENHPITFTAQGTAVDDSFPEGTIFVSADKINTFLANKWVGKYVASSDKTIMYRSSVATTLDGPYTVFTAPETGVYDVYALKRDNNSTIDPRQIRLIIAGEKYVFHKDGLDSSSVKYYWVPAQDSKTVSLTKGQKVVLRVPYDGHHDQHSGVHGFAFVPRTDPATKVEVLNTAQPNTQAGVQAVVNVSTYPIDYSATANVNIQGVDVAVQAGAASDFYPNVALTDTNGNAIENPTVLDALVAATKAGAKLPIDLKTQTLEDGVLVSEITRDKVTPVNYDTINEAGKMWTTDANGVGYEHLWDGNQIFCTNSSSKVFDFTINAPKSGNYYMFANLCSYYDTRGLDITINDSAIKMTGGNNSKPSIVVRETPVALNEGANAFSMKAYGGWVRCSYIGFVEAETYEAAQALVAEITSSKEAFNTYYAASGNFLVNGEITNSRGLVVTVNGVEYTGNFDKIIVPDGAVITADIVIYDKTSFKPVNLGNGFISAYGDKWSTDYFYNEYEDYTSKFFVKGDYGFTTFSISDENTLAGTYINGYLTLKQDLYGQVIDDVQTYESTGDDTILKIYFEDLPIKYSSPNGAQLYIDHTAYETWVDRSVFYADYDGDGVDETYHGMNIRSGLWNAYDASHLYLTNASSAAAARVTVTDKGDGVYNLTCNKTVPVCLVKVIKNGNVVTGTSIANDVIEFVDADGIDVTVNEGETLYVWKGTMLPKGNAMVPLCAPIVR